MRALVTGATGFLGSHLARALVERGDEVRVLVRPSSDRRRLAGLPVEEAIGDVTDPGPVASALDGVDAVFHCAAYVELGARDPGRMQQVNVEGTRHVLDAAGASGALVVHVSSVAALGPTGRDPVDESWWNPEVPSVAYERTKREAHLLARVRAEQGARVRIGIPGGIYGADDDSEMAKLIRTFVTYPTPVGYMPELVQSLVNVDDCAEGLVRIAERGEDGREYLLCADAVTFREWFRLIAAGAGRRPPVAYLPTGLVRWSSSPAATLARWLGGNPGLVTDTIALATRHQAFSGARARAELGWEPRPLAVGMAEMAEVLKREHERERAARRAARERARAARRTP
ncbi:NAD-dependent epimerase/dehydratase family protein [Rhabdothermincola sediminis]|uniref:NAD-dependent epimerase/dehydratase family protein n=1 Tax=Rhabdothermincola sediminis TaxID=2751370 RepID=UPI001AA0492E|nr:NAD-dependent epimerase/dehydratase family protein [Rhabdothermincola sediminis]